LQATEIDRDEEKWLKDPCFHPTVDFDIAGSFLCLNLLKRTTGILVGVIFLACSVAFSGSY